MGDYFAERAKDWDSRPVPAQISQGVFGAIQAAIRLSAEQTVMDFGAGTGLVCTKLAPHVKRIVAVDVSEAMLAQLAAKPELDGKVEIRCQDILERPLGDEFDLVVSAMAMHHVEDTGALLRTWRDHLREGGQIAIADLDSEEGDFHPPDTEGVFHFGFDREALGRLAEEAGFSRPEFVTAVQVHRDDKTYPVFLMTATRLA